MQSMAQTSVQDFRRRCCQGCHSRGTENDIRCCPPDEATGSLPTLVFLPSPAAPMDLSRQTALRVHCCGIAQITHACECLDNVLIQATPLTAAPHAAHAHELERGLYLSSTC